MDIYTDAMHPKRRTVLNIEDNVANAMLIADLIGRRDDLILITACNGSQGIQEAHMHQPDVILLDINLPDIGGMEVFKILLEDPPTSRIPVIALSSNALPSQINEGMQAGFFGYLTKPFKITALMTLVDDALAHTAALKAIA